jgi:short-subunit dehydrogenase
VNEAQLSQVKAALEPLDIQVSTHIVDVSQRELVMTCADEIFAIHGQVDILVNNAAVIVLDTLEDISYQDLEWVLNVNFWGVVNTTRAFLNYLKLSSEAHIVNLSSVDGLVPNPGNGAYSIAKAAVKTFTETLSQELHGTNVTVTCVIPGGVKTNLHRNARFFKIACPGMTRDECIEFFESAAMTSADKAARIIAQSMYNNKGRVLIGLDGQLIDIFARVMPRWTIMMAGHMSRNLKSKRLDWLQRAIRKMAGISFDNNAPSKR